MLRSLRSIIQEVNSAPDLHGVLQIIVRRVRQEMATEVCSVYMLDPKTGRYVFMATEGLNKSMERQFSLSSDEGILGEVVRREEPLNLEQVESHPSYKRVPDIGEEGFNAYLGVPIIHHRKVLGVLVVQQQGRRRYNEDEEAFLITMSAQLAGVIAHAEAVGEIDTQAPGDAQRGNKYFGLAGSPGIAIGHAVVMAPPADLYSVPSRRCSNPRREMAMLRKAVSLVKKDIRKTREDLSNRLQASELALFDAYIGMLEDKVFFAEIYDRVKAGQWAQGALSQVVLEHAQAFKMMEDPYIRERSEDVFDLGRRVLDYLQEGKKNIVFPDDTILIGEEITLSMLGSVAEEKLLGIVSVTGSSNSHIAIMGKGLGIPTVMGATDLPFTRLESAKLIIDGYEGAVYSNPTRELDAHYQTVFEEEKSLTRTLESLTDQPCMTKDGHRVTLLLNTGLLSGRMRALSKGAEGVGLYRTEIPFLLRERFPTEEEQRLLYREQLAAFAPRPVTMRTLDIGGDKALPYFPIKEENPFLGWRGIRVTLDHPEIFLVQVRAMLKASEDLNNLRIMLPMISSCQELDEATRLIIRAHREVVDEGFAVRMPAIGVMVEVPAAVYQAGELAKRVSFLSVGSNDLTQYLLAVDRNNSRVAEIYDSYHPAVLAALQEVVHGAHKEDREVSICGELAGDPGAAVLLVAMGYDSLSMSARNLSKVKSSLSRFSMDDAKALLAEVRKLGKSAQVHELVQLRLKETGLAPRLISSRTTNL